MVKKWSSNENEDENESENKEEAFVRTPTLLEINAIMKKKEYIKPETEVVELELESLMLSASNKVDIDISDDTTDEGAWMSNGRRGKWGDLWYQGEE